MILLYGIICIIDVSSRRQQTVQRRIYQSRSQLPDHVSPPIVQVRRRNLPHQDRPQQVPPPSPTPLPSVPTMPAPAQQHPTSLSTLEDTNNATPIQPTIRPRPASTRTRRTHRNSEPSRLQQNDGIVTQRPLPLGRDARSTTLHRNTLHRYWSPRRERSRLMQGSWRPP